MKKIFIFILLFLLIGLSGCDFLDDLFNNINTLEITLQVNETYQLEGYSSYQSENTNIATVNDSGLITAIQIGEVTITATSGDVIDTYTIYVIGDMGELIIDVIDVGQGDAILIQLPNNEVMMIDVGRGYSYSWTNINNVLQSYGITTIDHLVITHNHTDHYALVPDLLESYQVESVYTSGSSRSNAEYLNIMKAIDDAGLDVYVVEVGDKIIDETGLVAQVVATQDIDNVDNPNICSVMIKLTFQNTSFMFTGDGGFSSSQDVEHIALNSGIDLSADVLKVAHHGSDEASSQAFLDAVNPDYAILTTKEGNEDLPHPDTLARIEGTGAQIYQSYINGTITITSDGNNIDIKTEK